jgi:predicted dehydrogenase
MALFGEIRSLHGLPAGHETSRYTTIPNHPGSAAHPSPKSRCNSPQWYDLKLAMENQSNRRTFVQSAAAFTLAASYSRILGANDRVQVAVVGLGGRGRAHMKAWSGAPGVVVTALCDINQEALERGQAQVEKQGTAKPKGYEDMRKLFASKDVDAVSMPLPNHWHALATIWACQAGKDVYIEKPACHNPYEGGKMIEAARKYNRIVQVGSQGRTMPHKIRAIQLLREGVIGKIYRSTGICYKRRVSIGRKPDGTVPAGVNWDLFLGPAPMRAYNENRFKYNWHWFWDTGNGDIGNQGVHQMDIARWGLGKELPKAVASMGGKYAYDDDQETPNTQTAIFDYGDCELVFDVRGLITDPPGALTAEGKNAIGNIFYGSEGYLVIDDRGYQIYKGEKHEKKTDDGGGEKGEENSTRAHMENFTKAVRSRNYKDLTADVEIGVASATLCHLANASYRTKRKLAFDASRRQFLNDAEANKLLTREYRSPYVVPEKV